MNKVSLFMFLLPIAVSGADFASQKDIHEARRFGASIMELLRVIDQDGEPVVGASVIGAMQTGESMEDYSPIRGTTNTNGEFVIIGKCTNRLVRFFFCLEPPPWRCAARANRV